ncbi:MAG: hypothetical protein ACREIB_13920, partial [Pseudomonadota bacterium]
GGISGAEREVYEAKRSIYQDTVTGLKEDPLALATRRKVVTDLAEMDWSRPAEVGARLAENVKAAAKTRQHYGLAEVSALRQFEADRFASTVAGGSPQQAAAAMQGIADLPDETLVATLDMKQVKGALAGAARSRDFDRFGAAMVALDKIYTRSPQEAGRLFDKDTIDALQDWQGRLRYYNQEEMAAYFKNQDDPQLSARMTKLAKEGETLARKKPIGDIVAEFDASWLPFTTPSEPTDEGVRTGLLGDYEKLFGERYAATQDAAVAHTQTMERMRHNWGPSALNGGRLSLFPPESHYPQVGGSWDWMRTQLETDLVAAGHTRTIEEVRGKGGQLVKRTVP